MNFKCKTSEITRAFQLLTSVIPARSPRPALNNVKIEGKEDRLELCATDSEIALQITIQGVSVETPGIISIPGGSVAAILRETSDEEILFTSEAERCALKTRDSVYELSGDDPHNFPFVPFIEEAQAVELPVPALRESIGKTAFSTGKEKTRFALNGILLEISGNTMKMVATDGKRLSLITKELTQSVGEDLSAIVPTKAMNLVERITEGAEVAQLSLHESIIQFRVNEVTLCAKLVDGNFPSYNEVIPDDYTKFAKVDTATFFSGVRRAALFTSEDSRSIQMSLCGSKLQLKSRSEMAGNAEIEMEVENEGDLVEIAFNPDFLVDVLRVTSEPKFDLIYMDFNRPVLLKSEENYLNLIMPISASP